MNRALSPVLCSAVVYEVGSNVAQVESYFGNVNCIGERSCYDEGKRAAETLTFDYMREHGLEVCLWPQATCVI